MQAGDRVRVTAQLIDANTDEHLWAQSYERDARDVFALQSEVARAIVAEVQVELTPNDVERLNVGKAIAPAAYDLYLQGRYHWNRRTEPDLRRAVELFEQAIAIEPEYAAAYAALAQTHLVSVNWTPTPAEVAYPAAREAAEKALAIDPDNAAAWAALGGVAQEYEWDWDKSGEYYRKSLAIDPSVAGVHQWYAEHLAQQGRFDEALAEIGIARQLDPLEFIIRIVTGWILATANRPQEAIAEFEALIEMDPDWPGAYLYIQLPYLMVGREREAVEATARYVRLTGEPELSERVLAAYASRGMDGYWEESIAIFHATSQSPGLIGFSYAYWGKPDSAMVYLERAVEQHAFPIHVIAVTQWAKSMHDDPRYQNLIKRLKLDHVKPAFDDRP